MSTFPQSLGADISLARTDPGHKRRSRRSEREQRSVALRFTQRDFGIACLNCRQVSGPAARELAGCVYQELDHRTNTVCRGW